MTTSFRVEEDGIRADRLVGEVFPRRSRRVLAALFEQGLVLVNGKPAKKGERLEAGDLVEVLATPPDEEALRPIPEPSLSLDVLYHDEQVVVVNKPPGIPTHPLRAGELGTCANALVARFPECRLMGDDPREGGVAHRLDAGTSGVLVAARTPESWRSLRASFREGRATKEYLALVVGEVDEPGVVDVPIAHDPGQPGRALPCEDPVQAAKRKALPARTSYQPEELFSGFTLLRCHAETGRMHQIRVHLAHAGMPVVGDPLYGMGAAEPRVIGHFLHAARLCIPHPRTGEMVSFEAPLPPDRQAALASLRKR